MEGGREPVRSIEIDSRKTGEPTLVPPFHARVRACVRLFLLSVTLAPAVFKGPDSMLFYAK